MSSCPALRSGPFAMPMRRVSCMPCSASTSSAARPVSGASIGEGAIRAAVGQVPQIKQLLARLDPELFRLKA